MIPFAITIDFVQGSLAYFIASQEYFCDNSIVLECVADGFAPIITDTVVIQSQNLELAIFR